MYVGGSGNFETALEFFHERCDHMSISCFGHCLEDLSLLPLLDSLQGLSDIVCDPLSLTLPALPLDVVGLILIRVIGLEEG